MGGLKGDVVGVNGVQDIDSMDLIRGSTFEKATLKKRGLIHSSVAELQV